MQLVAGLGQPGEDDVAGHSGLHRTGQGLGPALGEAFDDVAFGDDSHHAIGQIHHHQGAGSRRSDSRSAAAARVSWGETVKTRSPLGLQDLGNQHADTSCLQAHDRSLAQEGRANAAPRQRLSAPIGGRAPARCGPMASRPTA